MAGRRFEGRVVIVTGAGSQLDEGIGNGRAAAVLFAREGARVLCVDRRAEAADATVAMIRGEGGSAAAFAADVTSEAECEAMVAKAIALWGRLDVLHNNVGIASGGTGEAARDWSHVLATNVTSMALASRAAAPAIAGQGGGAIVTISSIAGIRPNRMSSYAASKGAIIALTRGLAFELAPQGIRVNCVAPGPVYTPMVYAGGMSAELRERRRLASPLGIEGTGWDIGHAALFLASDEARYITGVVLPVDGGVLLTSAQ